MKEKGFIYLGEGLYTDGKKIGNLAPNGWNSGWHIEEVGSVPKDVKEKMQIGKKVSRLFQRGKAVVPIFEDGSTALESYVTNAMEDRNKLKGETREQRQLWNKAHYMGHTKEYYKKIVDKWEKEAKEAKSDIDYKFAEGQRKAWSKDYKATVKQEEDFAKLYNNPKEYKGDLGKVAGKHIDRIDTSKLDTKGLKDKEFIDKTIKEQRIAKSEKAIDRVNNRSYKELQKEYNRISDESKTRQEQAKVIDKINKYATNNGSGSDDNTSAYADKAIKYWEKQREDTIARGGDTSWEDDSIKKWKAEKANRLYGETLKNEPSLYEQVHNTYTNPRVEASYYLKKGEFSKFDQTIKDYGLEDEKDAFLEGANSGIRADYKIYSNNSDISPMSEYSDTTGTGYSDKQYKELQSGAYDVRTSTELRKQLKALEPYTQELQVGDRVIVNTGGGRYGVRNKDDFDDPMTDYSAYVYGFNAKSIIERAREKGIVVDKPKKTNTEAKIERFKQRKQGTTIDTMSKRELAEKIVENQISRGMNFTNKEEIIKDKMRMSKSDLLKYFK